MGTSDDEMTLFVPILSDQSVVSGVLIPLLALDERTCNLNRGIPTKRHAESGFLGTIHNLWQWCENSDVKNWNMAMMSYVPMSLCSVCEEQAYPSSDQATITEVFSWRVQTCNPTNHWVIEKSALAEISLLQFVTRLSYIVFWLFSTANQKKWKVLKTKSFHSIAKIVGRHRVYSFTVSEVFTKKKSFGARFTYISAVKRKENKNRKHLPISMLPQVLQ